MRISDWSSDVCSSDLALDVKLTTPRELGGAGGDGSNPEQLFAAGYSACFIGALKYVAAQEKIALPAAPRNDGEVGIGPIAPDRKSVVTGKGVSGRVDPGGRGSINKKKNENQNS